LIQGMVDEHLKLGAVTPLSFWHISI